MPMTRPDHPPHVARLRPAPKNLGAGERSFADEFEAVSGLQIRPESIRRAERPSKPRGRVGGDLALPMNDLVDESSRHVDRQGEPVLADLQRLEKLLEQDLTRVDRGVRRDPDGSTLIHNGTVSLRIDIPIPVVLARAHTAS